MLKASRGTLSCTISPGDSSARAGPATGKRAKRAKSNCTARATAASTPMGVRPSSAATSPALRKIAFVHGTCSKYRRTRHLQAQVKEGIVLAGHSGAGGRRYDLGAMLERARAWTLRGTGH